MRSLVEREAKGSGWLLMTGVIRSPEREDIVGLCLFVFVITEQ